MNELLVKLRFLLSSLPRAEKAVAEYLLHAPESITSTTLAILAQETGSSEASIVRFCRRMGFDGFTDLKQAFMAAQVDSSETVLETVEENDTMQAILSKVFRNNMQVLTDTLALVTPDYDKALDILLKAKSVHFFGVGDAHAVCQLAHLKFSRLSIPGSAYSDVTMQLIAASSLSKGDVAFAVSYSGSTRTTVQAMKVAKEVGATCLCITRESRSPLLKHTDVNMFIATNDSSASRFILSRRIADQAILDALYLGMLTRSGEKYNIVLKKSQKAIDVDKL